MQKQFMGVTFTDHAIKRLYERGIVQSDAWYTFRHPDKQSRGTTPGSYRYSKSRTIPMVRGKSYGQQRIEIIAKQNEKKEWVILSCWSKMVGDGRPIFPQKENLLWSLTKKIGKKLWNRVKNK